MPGVKRPAPALLLVLVLLAAGALLDCFALRVDGQPRDRAALLAALLEREQAFILARICVSEGGWGQPDACAAYHFALISKAATVRVDWDEHAKKYTRLFDPHHPPRRIWLLGLGASVEKPIGFPPQLPWQTLRDRHGRQLGRLGYLDRWREEVRVATELVRSPRNPCAGVPLDWGSGARVDFYKAENPRWVEIDCPGDDTFLRPSPG